MPKGKEIMTCGKLSSHPSEVSKLLGSPAISYNSLQNLYADIFDNPEPKDLDDLSKVAKLFSSISYLSRPDDKEIGEGTREKFNELESIFRKIVSYSFQKMYSPEQENLPVVGKSFDLRGMDIDAYEIADELSSDLMNEDSKRPFPTLRKYAGESRKLVEEITYLDKSMTNAIMETDINKKYKKLPEINDMIPREKFSEDIDPNIFDNMPKNAFSGLRHFNVLKSMVLEILKTDLRSSNSQDFKAYTEIYEKYKSTRAKYLRMKKQYSEMALSR